MNKRCKQCLEDKELSMFYRNNRNLDGYTSTCKKCIGVYRKERYWNNREKAIADSVEWGKKNKEKRKIVKKRWADKNKTYIAVINKNLNARKQGAEGSFSLQEYNDKLDLYKNRCGYCSEREPYTVDHIVPISKGGTNYIDNIMPCCLQCNGQKRDYLLDEWKTLSNCYYKD